MEGRPDALNPAELLLVSLAACMIKGAERVAPMINFDVRGLEVSLHGQRQDNPPKMVAITDELLVDTAETDEWIELLDKNIRKYGTISNTLDDAVELSGTIRENPDVTVPSSAPPLVVLVKEVPKTQKRAHRLRCARELS